MNKCKYCPNEALSNKTRCDICRIRESTQKKERREQAKKDGVCTICFTSLAEIGLTKCRNCLTNEVKRSHKVEHQRIAEGKCRECGSTELFTSRMCKNCRNTKAAEKRAYTIKLRLVCVTTYGGKCTCCGDNRNEYLILDHINGGGAKHRETEKGSKAMYLWAQRNNFPPVLQLLCANCHLAKHRGISCPHSMTVGTGCGLL